MILIKRRKMMNSFISYIEKIDISYIKITRYYDYKIPIRRIYKSIQEKI